MRYYTSIEQSKKLLELGLNPESADLFWMYDSKDTWELVMFDWKQHQDTRDIPCWSVGALEELLPNVIKNGKEMYNWFWFNLNKEPYQISYGNNLGSSGEWHDWICTPQRDTLLEVCYDMIVWLVEHNHKLKNFSAK